MFNPRKSMLDDERYPIAVFPDEFPTAPQVPQPTFQSQSPLLANNGATRNVPYVEPVAVASPVSSMGSTTQAASSIRSSILSTTETVSNPPWVSSTMYKSDPTMYKGDEQWKTPAFDSELLRAPPARSNSVWRQFNVWKVLIFAFMAFVAGVVITTVVLNQKMKHPKLTKAAAAAASASATMNITTAALSSTTASVASSGLYLQDGTTWNMQVYYQPANTTLIMYRMDLVSGDAGNETFETARNMTLTIPPKSGSPITATASTDTTGVVYLDIFYITSDNNIAQAHLACPVNSSNCKTTSNMVISEGAQPLHSNSSLTAVNVNEAQDWRIYYQNTNHNIVELAGNSSGFNQGVTIYSGSTLTGSSLSAVNILKSTNNINVFFVDYDSQALYYTQFTTSWQTALPITTANVETWNPTSKLAAVYNSTPGWLRLYYVGTDSKVWEYVGINASKMDTIWNEKPDTSTTWIRTTNTTQDITATAFKDQVRWWQYSSALGLLEAALDNSTWTENRVL